MEIKKKRSLISQVAMIFVVCTLLTALFTYATMLLRSDREYKQRTETLARKVALDVKMSMTEYPAIDWLIRYWHENWDNLDIEYDVLYYKNSRTAAKVSELLERNPGLMLKYVNDADAMAMSDEDQKLYAEIIYNWLTNSINQIKKSHEINYLFVVLTDDTFEEQFFLLSGADTFARRGTDYEDVYTLGVTVKASDIQMQAMKDAVDNNVHFAKAGNYADYYEYILQVDDDYMLIGITYDLSLIMKSIDNETNLGTGFATGWQVALMLICLAMTLGFVVTPLKKIQSAIRKYMVSKDSKAVSKDLENVHPANEIGELSDDIIDLSKSIDQYIVRIEKITDEKSRLDAELNMAKNIQASMLPQTFPPFPDRTEFDIYAEMDPAKMVGGDFYDFFMIDKDHLGLMIADVSGKGIPAALFMTVCLTVLKNSMMLRRSIKDVLANTNEALCHRNMNQMFVTVWIAILEISTGKLTVANAGHEYPTIRRSGGDFEILKDKHDFIVGGMPHIEYHEYELQLNPGDKIFVYTDGVPEANDKDKQMFGTERMLKALNIDPDADPQQIINNVDNAIKEFVKEEEQFDDITMLCIEYKGKK